MSLKVGIGDLNSVIRRILGEDWQDITDEEVETMKEELRQKAPYPWCSGNPTIKDCIEAGCCRRNPSCGD
jgi:hypothetical protein